jgi:hypothetical protein
MVRNDFTLAEASLYEIASDVPPERKMERDERK